MTNYRHLSLNERKTIEELMNQKTSFTKIAKKINRERSTIVREVQRNFVVKRTGAVGQAFNNCLNRKGCEQFALCKKEDCSSKTCKGCKFCFRLCPDFERESCNKLKSPPYVCNGCTTRHKCTLEKFIYSASDAHRAYGAMLVIARSGLAISIEELIRLDNIISPLLKKGQSINVIVANHKDEIMLDESTLYRYVKEGLFTAKPTDLLNMVKMKPRRKKPSVKVDRACRTGRTYRDFINYMDANPDTALVQMDSVLGKQPDGSGNESESVLLTIHFVRAEFMLAFKRSANTAKSVTEIINMLYGILGKDTFVELFPLVLVDCGSEFSNPSAIEKAPDGTVRTKLFYTNPGAPYEKGACENNHSLIRRIIPKGISLNPYSPEDINLALNHVNSYTRKKLNYRCPIEVFNFFNSKNGEAILQKLGVVRIHPDEVNLTPALLKK